MIYYRCLNSQKGFSLLELILVIIILSVLAGISASLISQPFEAQADIERRARLADIGDQILLRLSRDLRLALPNSTRVTVDGTAIEFILGVSGGRYRAQIDNLGSGDILDFSASDSSFDVLGNLIATPVAGQWVVIYNLAASGSQASAYAGDNRAVVSVASTASRIQLASPFKFPFRSPAQRFFVADGAVTYRCNNSGQMIRHWGYTATTTMVSAPAGGNSAVMADRLSACQFRYDPGSSSRNALIEIAITVNENGDSATFYKTVHLANTP